MGDLLPCWNDGDVRGELRGSHIIWETCGFFHMDGKGETFTSRQERRAFGATDPRMVATTWTYCTRLVYTRPVYDWNFFKLFLSISGQERPGRSGQVSSGLPDEPRML